MSEKVPCPHCGKRVHDHSAAYQHIKAKHGRGMARAYRRLHGIGPEESMADIFVRAQINRAMGIQNEEWIEEMLP